MPGRILVAVDGSPTSDAALVEAARTARERSAALRLVHVVDSPYAYPDVLYGRLAVDFEAVRRLWRETGQAVLDRGVATARQEGVEPETALLESDGHRPASVIVGEAERWGADLVVVGTHGRRGLERLLMGSVAEGVARLAPVSVLLVRARG
jgi:nucleotide-binding universal stress UspA family protein